MIISPWVLLLIILGTAGLTAATAFLLHKRVVKPLKEQNFQFSAMYQSIPDLIFCKDINSAFTSCNQAFIDVMGLSESEIIGKTDRDLHGGKDNEFVNHIMEADRQVIYEQRRIVSRYWRPNRFLGDRLYEAVKMPLIQDGKPVGLVGVIRDITEHHLAEKAAQKASEAKSAFLARMSHEIRTPMNAILGMAELALRENTPPATREHILTIRQSSKNLLSIINDILDFSKIETGKMEIIPEEYRLSSLINDVINIIKMRMHDSGLRFVVDADGGIPDSLYGDATRIRQILLNILTNAVKYTEKGYVSMSVTGKTEENILHLTVAIADSGIGIKEEDQQNLFTEFTQFDITRNRNVEGTGLGLAIAHSLVKAMDGDISVISRYGEGSVFTVVIPQEIKYADRMAVVNEPASKQVLVYERRELFTQSIIRAMESLGVAYLIVTDESEFLRESRSGSYNFIFIATQLYDKVKKTHGKLNTTAQLILITEFGESVNEPEAGILAAPIFSVPVAKCLNGYYDSYLNGAPVSSVVHFTAPGARVLLVDDIATNLKVAEGLLLPYKMRIDLCKSGREAIEAVQANSYDIIFMDHMMPGMNGVEAAARIRALGYTNIPIVALTANAVTGTREMFLENGFQDFLSKPIDTTYLNTILSKWIPREKQV